MNSVTLSHPLRFVLIGSLALLLVTGCAGQQTEPPESPPAESTVTDNPQEQTEEESPRKETAEEPEEPTGEDDASAEQTEPTVAKTRPAMPESVSNYIDLARQGYTAPEGKEKYDHAFTADRLRGLASALENSAEVWELDSNRRNTIEEKTRTLRRVADRIQAKRIVPHSESVLNGLRAGREALELFVGKGDVRDQQLAIISNSVESFDPGVVLLRQKNTIVTYFQGTANFFKALYE